LKIKNIGVLQGSTLGPLLFLIYINDLPKSVDFTPRLADDTCLVVTAPSIDQLKSRLNSEMNKTFNWMSANKLTLNATKSKLLMINLKHNSILTNISINCKSSSIKSVNQAKYLGVILDHNLSFRDHIKVVETKITRAVGIICKLKY